MNDKRAILQVIGSLIQQPSLLLNYDFELDDFPERFHQVIFASIKNLYERGVNVNFVNIDSYLANYEAQYNIFTQNDGLEYLQKAEEITDPADFTFFHERVKKYSLLRKAKAKGIDVSFIYNENETDPKKQQEMQEKFDSYTLKDLLDLLDQIIIEIKDDYVHTYNATGKHAGEGAEELKEELRENPELGLPMQGEILNTITRGARLKKFYLRSAPTGVGKALPNTTIIPTPSGFKQVGEIKIGDYVFGQDGKPTKVLQVYPQGEQQIWEVTFSDGRRVECCGEHLWEYRYHSHKDGGKYSYRVETTEQIYERTKKLKNGFKNAWQGKGYRFHVKLNEPLNYKEKDFDIDPYIMGLILGDGSFRYDSNKAFTFSGNDIELVETISYALGVNYKKNSNHNYSYTFKTNDYNNLHVETLLKSYPSLWNIKSEEKFIPEEYFEGSIEQRYSLLQGLLDADGHIDNKGKGRVSYTTVSPILKKQVISLCQSLGMVATYLIDKRTEKYTTGKCYHINIQCKKEDKPKLFRLKRKKEIAKTYVNNNKREEHKTHLAITDIRPTDKKAKMTCFTVENEDGLFLANDYIVTHNSRLAAGDATLVATDEYYSYEKGWIPNSKAFPTLFITSELEIEEIQTLMWSFISGVNEQAILDGDLTESQEKRVDHAIEAQKRSNMWIEHLPNYSVSDVAQTIKKYHNLYGIRYVFFDYIHTTLKMLEETGKEIRMQKLREDTVLSMFSTTIKDLSNELGIFVYSGTQLSSDWESKKNPNQNLIRGAKSVADKLDVGMIALEPTKEELDLIAPIIEEHFMPQPNIVFHIYKVRRGKHNNVKVFSHMDLGTCRMRNLFLTNQNCEIMSATETNIIIDDDD